MIRRYEEKDDRELKEMLAVEGINEDEMFYKNPEADTFVLDKNGIKGFFTIRKTYGFPSLQHFATKRQFRSASLARELAGGLKLIIKLNGLKKMIIHAKEGYLRKVVEYYFKAKPYSVKGETSWYIVEV